MKLKKPQLLLFLASLLTVFLFSACEKIIDPPQQIISIEEANRFEEEFKNTRSAVLDSALGFQDTRDFWFSLDSLKQYIAYVEQQGELRGKKNLGIRIYYAAYPPNSNYPDPGYATVFLVPTAQERGLSTQRGFLPIDEDDLNQNIDSLAPLNYGGGGIPPNDFNDDN
jgi:hypothetical protein